MGEKIVVGPINRGLRNDRTAFNIDNDSFPTLINAYQWRGRIKRKRGTSLLNRLRKAFPEASIGNSGASQWTINTIYSNYTPPVTPEANAAIDPGSVVITIQSTPEIRFEDQGDGTLDGFKIGTITNATQANPCEITSNGHTLSTGDTVTITGVAGMTELNGNTYTITVTGVNTFTLDGVDSTGFGAYGGGGTWTSPSSANSGTINYLTGVIVLTHTAGAGVATVAYFAYFPNLPVMGLRDLVLTDTEFPGTLGFDTKYAYNILTVEPYDIYNVNFYKNPSTATYPGYVQKTTWTEFNWNGQDYQQFWTINYQGALWASNGVEVPFDITNIGMQYVGINNIAAIVAGPPAFATITTSSNHGLSIGDFVFINEVVGVTGINFQTGYVTAVPAANQITVEFPNATLGGAWVSGGIVQYLTNNFDDTKDCIRWYDGDPTDGIPSDPTPSSTKGWVNFCPPLSQEDFSISDLPAAQYYLVGAKIIFNFKDRLLFIGPVVQTSTLNSQVYLPDTVIYSQNGTPYYTASFTGDPVSIDTVFNSILVPDNQTATAPAFFSDQTGFGGFIQAGIAEPIFTVSANEDVLIMGFSTNQARFVYTGNDLIPFNFFLVNSELGSNSTFSAINMDRGVITKGSRGFIITSQTEAKRIDLEIPDQIFQINSIDNGTERTCSQRDFINEWIYFTYPSNEAEWVFPTQTLQYNYRDDSWAIFNECYTTYGSFRKRTGFIWSTVGNVYPTWDDWNVPWEAGSSTLLQPEVIGGNQQGFILVRDDGTGEGRSLYIKSFSGSTVTSPDHCLNENDFIIIQNCIGTISAEVNGKIFQVNTVTEDTFDLNPVIGSGTYLGGGEIIRLYVPFIQTKQFPSAWGMARKTRIGPQQYLLSTTESSQIQLLIFLSQNASSAYNEGTIVPAISPTMPVNNSLIYNSVLYTCPESTNLGLTPANSNLQMVTAVEQAQIWHRMNTSLIGDTVQIGFTLSDEQMFTYSITGESFDITGATQTNPCVLTCEGQFDEDRLIQITGVEGMTELNNRIFQVLASDATTVTIDVDATGFTAYTDGGIATPVAPIFQTAEIVIHGMILDVSPSQVLA